MRELERGQLGLTDSLEKYEQGVKQLRACYRALDAAQRRIEILLKMDAAGQATTRPFLDEADDGDASEQTGASAVDEGDGFAGAAHSDVEDADVEDADAEDASPRTGVTDDTGGDAPVRPKRKKKSALRGVSKRPRKADDAGEASDNTGDLFT